MVPFEWVDEIALGTVLDIPVPRGTLDHLRQSAVNVGQQGSGWFVAPGVVLSAHHVFLGLLGGLDISGKAIKLLPTGFAARSIAEEFPLEGLELHVSKGIEDVTGEVSAALANKNTQSGQTKVIEELTKKYEIKGEKVSLVPRWRGARWYKQSYRTYGDVRLILLPSLSQRISADLVAFRVYDHGYPLLDDKYLPLLDNEELATNRALSLGFPGTTLRTTTEAERFAEEKLERSYAETLTSYANWQDSLGFRDPVIKEALSAVSTSELDRTGEDPLYRAAMKSTGHQFSQFDAKAFDEHESIHREMAGYGSLLKLLEHRFQGTLFGSVLLAEWALKGESMNRHETPNATQPEEFKRRLTDLRPYEIQGRREDSYTTQWFVDQLMKDPTVAPIARALLGTSSTQTLGQYLFDEAPFIHDAVKSLFAVEPAFMADVLSKSDDPLFQFSFAIAQKLVTLGKQKDVDLGRLAHLNRKLGEALVPRLPGKRDPFSTTSLPDGDGTLRMAIYDLETTKASPFRFLEKYQHMIEVDSVPGWSGGPTVGFIRRVHSDGEDSNHTVMPVVLGSVVSNALSTRGKYAVGGKSHSVSSVAIRKFINDSQAEHLKWELRGRRR